MRGTWLPETCWATSRKEVEALDAKRSRQPSRSQGIYQHKAIKSRSRQILMKVTWLPETCWATSRKVLETLAANRSWHPSRSHGIYQHKATKSRSLQLLMMGTWLPETCWATIRREIKNTKSDISLVFLIHICISVYICGPWMWHPIRAGCLSSFHSVVGGRNCVRLGWRRNAQESCKLKLSCVCAK